MHMIFISHTFYIKKMKTLFAQENFCGVFSSMVFVSQLILNKAKIHTQVLFCCLKCPLATT